MFTAAPVLYSVELFAFHQNGSKKKIPTYLYVTVKNSKHILSAIDFLYALEQLMMVDKSKKKTFTFFHCIVQSRLNKLTKITFYCLLIIMQPIYL